MSVESSFPPSSQFSLRRRLSALHDAGGSALVDAPDSCTRRIPVPAAESRTVRAGADPATRAALLAEADTRVAVP